MVPPIDATGITITHNILDWRMIIYLPGYWSNSVPFPIIIYPDDSAIDGLEMMHYNTNTYGRIESVDVRLVITPSSTSLQIKSSSSTSVANYKGGYIFIY